MQILIFEGIATSGKSTIAKELAKSLPISMNIVEADEEATHVPIMEQKEGLHIDFFENLIKNLVGSKPQLVIIDRLYMTQAFRAKCGLN